MLSNLQAGRKAKKFKLGAVVWHGEPGLLQPGTVTRRAWETKDGLHLIGIDYEAVFCEFVHRSPRLCLMGPEYGGDLGSWVFAGRAWSISRWKRVYHKINGRLPGECWRKYWQSDGKKSVCAIEIYRSGGRVKWTLFDRLYRIQMEGTAETIKGAAIKSMKRFTELASSEMTR